MSFNNFLGGPLQYGSENEDNFMDEQIENGGLNPDNYTEEQKWLMTEPSNGPENFYCDGEITKTQAMKRWKDKLRNSGLTAAEIKKCVKLNFG